MLLRMFDNTIIEAAVKPSAIHLWLRITVVLLAVVVIIGITPLLGIDHNPFRRHIRIRCCKE